MRNFYYVFFGLLFVASVFTHNAANEQILAWAKVFDVLAGMVVVFYIATMKFRPQTKWQGVLFGVLALGVIAPVTIVSVSYLAEDWGNLFGQVMSPDEALVDASDSGISTLTGAKMAFKDLILAIFNRDSSSLANSRDQVHWWIAYFGGLFLFVALIYRGAQFR
jgi:hypothetical protein